MHIPEKAIIKEQNASFKCAGIVVIESIIAPFEISNIPHKKAVITSFLKGEKTNNNSHITEKNTIYPPIITDVVADSLTESVNGFLIVSWSAL